MRRFHNAKVYIPQQPVKRFYSFGGDNIARGGVTLFNGTLLHPPSHPASPVYLLALSSIFVAPYRSRSRRLKSYTARRRPARVSFANDEIKRSGQLRERGR